MKINIAIAGVVLLSSCALADDKTLVPAKVATDALPAREVSFKTDVQPILQDYCVSCHAPGRKGTIVSGLDLTSYKSLMKGTKYGPVVIPGDSGMSTFTRLLTGTNKGLKMPMGLNASGTLARQHILTLRNWVKQGAKDN